MGRAKKKRKSVLKKKRLLKVTAGIQVPFTLSNCTRPLKGLCNRYVYKANVHNCSFKQSNFKNVRYRGGHITFSSFKQATLAYVDFIGVNLKNSKFKGTQFKNCLFFNCKFENADFKDACLENVYFITCNLKNAKNFIVTEKIYVINQFMPLNISDTFIEVIEKMRLAPKLEKYHIVTTTTKKANYWMLQILLMYYTEAELIYFFSKLLLNNKIQFYSLFGYILSLQNYYKK